MISIPENPISAVASRQSKMVKLGSFLKRSRKLQECMAVNTVEVLSENGEAYYQKLLGNQKASKKYSPFVDETLSELRTMYCY